MKHELPIPPAALRDPQALEMIRVWIAKQKLHCVLKVGFWEDQGKDELKAWGMLLADMIHHIANAYASEYGRDAEDIVREIRRAFEIEMNDPTSARRGEFVKMKSRKKK